MKNRVKYIPQVEEKDCGPACLSMIFRYYGLHVTTTKISQLAGTDRNGTTIQGLIDAAEHIGFHAKGVKAKGKGSLQDLPLPAIAHIINSEGVLHFVVIEKVEKNNIKVVDPEKGLVNLSKERFFKDWTKFFVLISPKQNFKKVKGKRKTQELFMSLLQPHYTLLIPIFLASLLVNVIGFVGTFYFQFLIDGINNDEFLKKLHLVSIGMIVLYMLHMVVSYARNHLIIHLSQKMDYELVLRLYRYVIKLPTTFFESKKVGDIVTRFIDTSKIQESLSVVTITLMIDTVMVTLGTYLLYVTSQKLFFITLIFVPIYILIIIKFNKPFESINKKIMESNSRYTSFLVESLSGNSLIKSYNAEEQVVKKTRGKLEELLLLSENGGRLANLQDTLKSGVDLIGGIIILWIGGIQVLNGVLTIGELVTFSALLAFFLEPIKNLVGLQPTLQSAIVAGNRVNEIFDLETEKSNEVHNSSKLTGKIKFKNVSFSYSPRKKVLNDINLIISPGEHVAFVGKSGSGKTTISKLLMNFYDTQEGYIYYGEHNIKEVNKSLLRDKIAYVSQDSFFFSGTITENLEFGLNRPINLEEMIEACKKACIHDSICEMPLNYDTVLEENASNLSGGQKQRLAMARLFLKDAEVLMLDEATSNLDTTTEKSIINTLNDIKQFNKTIISITHKLETIEKADKIIVLDKGMIVESGTHQELLNKQSYYFDLWSSRSLH